MDPVLMAGELVEIASSLPPDSIVCLELPASVINAHQFSSSSESFFAVAVEKASISSERPDGSPGGTIQAGPENALRISLAPGETERLFLLRKKAVSDMNALFGDEQEMLFEFARAQRALKAALSIRDMMMGRKEAGLSNGSIGLESAIKAVDDAIEKFLACEIPISVPIPDGKK
ncbi:hypothetical protein [Dyella flagellata]|uniref:Uncharacterized protein n=1 Tax=Dyella flagellata TaxID=1867833 RepID=A0ABQ5X9W7_9GAMM|nr:hypothetical protein [Dyella flagellata]GLQ87863.1 hypothetical protein GCM10007898_14310 [Dyella flagellata]